MPIKLGLAQKKRIENIENRVCDIREVRRKRPEKKVNLKLGWFLRANETSHSILSRHGPC